MSRALLWAWGLFLCSLLLTYAGQVGWAVVFFSLGVLAFVTHMLNGDGKS